MMTYDSSNDDCIERMKQSTMHSNIFSVTPYPKCLRPYSTRICNQTGQIRVVSDSGGDFHNSMYQGRPFGMIEPVHHLLDDRHHADGVNFELLLVPEDKAKVGHIFIAISFSTKSDRLQAT